MPDYVRALPHPAKGDLRAAVARLAASTRTPIAHIDSGAAPHPGIGWTDPDAPPPNLRLDLGRNLLDPKAGDARPIANLTPRPGLPARVLEYPDHGTKTLSALIGDVPGKLTGTVPGAQVVPYRVSNGPLFRRGAGPFMGKSPTALIGRAINRALDLAVPARVIAISMGNPGFLGFYEGLRAGLGGEIGMSKVTGHAVDRAYEAGAIMVCAAGQVIDRVVYPARYARTIAVGGFDVRGADYDHYPPGGYADPTRVDIWAQAERINRAAFDMRSGAPVPVWADDVDQGEPSGTSYACPQVAGAAALWVETHFDALEGMFGAPEARWKMTEAFRTALRASADRQMARVGSVRVSIRALNVPRLLATPPAPVADRARAGRAAAAGFW